MALKHAVRFGTGNAFANILEFIEPSRYLILPNTAGAMNAEKAVRIVRIARLSRASELTVITPRQAA